MMTLASTLTRCEPRRGGGVSRFLGRVVMLLVLSALAGWTLHVVGHIHRACLRYQAQILEVSRP
jgi:hypothetical protein